MDSVMSPAFSLEPNETLFRAFLGESLFIGAYFLFQKPCLSGVRVVLLPSVPFPVAVNAIMLALCSTPTCGFLFSFFSCCYRLYISLLESGLTHGIFCPSQGWASYFHHVSVPLSIDKLDGIKVWHKGQDYVDHLATKVDSIPCVDRSFWNKIDAQLCGVLKTTVQPHSEAYILCSRDLSRSLGTDHRFFTPMILNALMGFVNSSWISLPLTTLMVLWLNI